MQLQTAQRKHARIKMGMQGPSGSGKTYSSLVIAKGLCGDYSKVAVVDTENRSAHLYAHLGAYNVYSLSAPFTPERYIEALTACEKAGMEVVIIDSVSHEWENLLEYHGSLQGNSFTNWAKITPRHNAFIQRILQSPCHIILTLRTKQDYVLNEKNGKMVPEKVGLKSVQRDGMDYEMTLVLDMDMGNLALASKDRTGLFHGTPAFKPTEETGTLIRDWCASGSPLSPEDVIARINGCRSLNELLEVYKAHPEYKKSLLQEFENQKRRLLVSQDSLSELSNNKINQNGQL